MYTIIHIVIASNISPPLYCTYTYHADIDACLCIQVLIDSNSIMTKEGKTIHCGKLLSQTVYVTNARGVPILS